MFHDTQTPRDAGTTLVLSLEFKWPVNNHQAVYVGAGQRAMMPCGWEGNHRSGITLVMCHRLMVYPPTGSN